MEQTQEGILVDADLTQEWPWLREAIDEGIAQWGDTDYSYDLIIDLEFYYHVRTLTWDIMSKGMRFLCSG